ncbi:hypothetical protein Pfo_007881 [Paulownia fortunei]|nr:hypothetical protein Pfo_007881 [Paulownia fortunei]
MAKSWEEQADLARSCLEKARRRINKWADEKRRPQEFNMGNQVLVKLLAQQFKALYEGSFPVVAKVGKVSYRIDLPTFLKIHHVFHVVSMLKPYHEDEEDPKRGQSHPAPHVVTKYYDKEIEEVLTKKIIRRHSIRPYAQYLIKWKGLPESEVTWESIEDLLQFQDQLLEYEATKASPN